MARVSASCARWPPESLPAFWSGSRPSRSIRRSATPASQPGLSRAPEPEVVGDASARRRSACPGRRSRPRPSWAGPWPGGRRAPRSCPGRREQADGQVSSVVLPAPLGPTSPTTRPAGIVSVQSGAPSAGRSACPGRAARGRRSRHVLLRRSRERWSRNRASMLSSSSPACAGLGEPAAQVAAQRPVGGERGRRSASWSRTCRPRAGRDQAVVLELAVGLEHGVRVDRQRADDLLDRRAAGPPRQQAQPQRLPHLLDQLQVRRRRPSGRPGGTRSPATSIQLGD